MEFDRRVQVRVRLAGTAARGFGTGYLVAPGLVLTAAHVLNGMADPAHKDTVTVCQPDAGTGQFPATVRWRRKDTVVDAALIEVAATDAAGRPWPVSPSLTDLLTRPPQRYGHLIGTRPHPVTLTGFPRLQKAPDDGGRLDEQLTGHIAPGTGALAGRYEVAGTDPVPHTDATSGGTPWSGMSGAAVLADDGWGGDLLCGVVRHDRQPTGGTRLTATRGADLVADADFRALVAEHTGWEPVLEPAEPAGLLAPAAPGRGLDSPAALLRADAEAVRFHGRDAELADLRAWCVADSATISVRVLIGPGGQGKTRLARHLADALGRDGWATGHLRSDLTDHDPRTPDFTLLSTALRLFLVVDYAETRPRLLRDLITALHRTRYPVRLLLLARSDGPWRTDALNALPAVRRLLAAGPVTELAPLIPPAIPPNTRSLINLGVQLSETKRLDEALAATEEAVGVYRRLVVGSAGAYEPDLARSLSNLGAQLSGAGRPDEALAATEGAMDIYRRHLGTLPALLPQVHVVLAVRAQVLDGLGREDEAQAVRQWLAENPVAPDVGE